MKWIFCLTAESFDTRRGLRVIEPSLIAISATRERSEADIIKLKNRREDLEGR